MATSQNNDQALLRAAGNGDRAALAQLYDAHASAMLATALRVLGNSRDAEDLVHDVFLEAWKRADSYDGARGSVRTWLLLRLRSRALDRLRVLARMRTQSAVGEDVEQALVAVDGDPVDEAERSKTRRLVAQLSDAQRQVIELCYFQGMTCQEVADSCDIPVGTVKSRLSGAIARLRSKLPEQTGAPA